MGQAPRQTALSGVPGGKEAYARWSWIKNSLGNVNTVHNIASMSEGNSRNIKYQCASGSPQKATSTQRSSY